MVPQLSGYWHFIVRIEHGFNPKATRVLFAIDNTAQPMKLTLE